MKYEPLPIIADPGIQEHWSNASFNSAGRKANSLRRLGTNSYNLNSRGFYTSDAARTA